MGQDAKETHWSQRCQIFVVKDGAKSPKPSLERFIFLQKKSSERILNLLYNKLFFLLCMFVLFHLNFFFYF